MAAAAAAPSKKVCRLPANCFTRPGVSGSSAGTSGFGMCRSARSAWRGVSWPDVSGGECGAARRDRGAARGRRRRMRRRLDLGIGDLNLLLLGGREGAGGVKMPVALVLLQAALADDERPMEGRQAVARGPHVLPEKVQRALDEVARGNVRRLAARVAQLAPRGRRRRRVVHAFGHVRDRLARRLRQVGRVRIGLVCIERPVGKIDRVRVDASRPRLARVGLDWQQAKRVQRRLRSRRALRPEVLVLLCRRERREVDPRIRVVDDGALCARWLFLLEREHRVHREVGG